MSRKIPTLEEWLSPLDITTGRLCSLAFKLSNTYSHLALHSSEQFLPTPVTKFPSGSECGEYLALDLGGTNLRVAFVSLLGAANHVHTGEHAGEVHNSISITHEKSWAIDDRFKVEKPDDLFAWIGDCLAEVVRARMEIANHLSDEIPLGITFSFPMIQSSLTEATLMPMGKGFAINSSLSLGELIYTGYARHTKKTSHDDLLPSTGLPRLNIVAIANDAVATLISSMYTTGPISNRRSVVGLILGTGCNASTVMERQCLDLQKGSSGTCTTDNAKIIVNTEWTIRGTAGPLHDLELVTAWDNAVSVGAHSPGFQPFEYMTAGSYLGEIVRVLVVDWYINVLGIPKTHLPPQLLEANGITTTFLAQSVAVSADPVALASNLNQTCTLGNNQMWTWTAELARVLLEAEKIVLRRSAALVAAALLGLLISTRDLPLERSEPGEEHDPDRRHQPQELVVGYCGGLICLYRGYREQIQDFIDAILDQISVPGQNPHHKVILEEVSQGGLIGAAVLANMVLETLC